MIKKKKISKIKNSNFVWFTFNLCAIIMNAQNTIDILTLLQNQPDLKLFEFNNSSECLLVKTSIVQNSDLFLMNQNELKMDFLFEGLNSSIVMINQANVSIVNFNFVINSSDYALKLYQNSSLLIEVKIYKSFTCKNLKF